MSKMGDLDALLEVAREIKDLTGDDFYLYTSMPGDGQTRVVFQDGVQQGHKAGLNHARTRLIALEQLVRAGIDVKGIGEQGFQLAYDQWRGAGQR